MGKGSERFIEAPIKGLNWAGNLMSQAPGTTLQLDNVNCTPWGLEPLPQFTVSGSKPAAASTAGTLLPNSFHGLAAVCAGSGGANHFYSISITGTWTAIPGAPALSGSHIGNSVIMAAASGAWTFFFNGTGAGYSINPATGGIAASGITGPTNIASGTVYRQRLYVIEGTSQSIWYLAAGAVTGAATAYDLTSLLPRAGKPVAITSLTMDGGNGPDDYLLVLTHTGEMAVFYGNDPGAGDWRPVGVFNTAPPPVVLVSSEVAAARLTCKVGGDVWFATRAGLRSAVAVVRGREDSPSEAINPVLQFYHSITFNTGTCRLFHLDSMNLIILNVSNSRHFVMNTQTKGWSMLTKLLVPYTALKYDIAEITSTDYWGFRWLSEDNIYSCFDPATGACGESIIIASPGLRFGDIWDHKVIQARPLLYSSSNNAWSFQGVAQDLTGVTTSPVQVLSTQFSAAGRYFGNWLSPELNTGFITDKWKTYPNNGGMISSLFFRGNPTVGSFCRFLGWDVREEQTSVGGP